jgi:two-component system, response regulator
MEDMNDNVILLIEDSPDDVALIRRSLRQNNIMNDIIVLRDGAEALDWFMRTGDYADRDPDVDPALILLDIRLPRVDGLEVLRRLREDESWNTAPIVILTSSQEEEDLFRSYELGANSYVRKPINFAEFSEAVGEVGLYWLLINERAPRRRKG